MGKLSMSDFCNRLIRCETESDVKELLLQEGYWNNPGCWKAYGGFEDNWSIVNNQQTTPEASLVEILVNSCDANLTLKCLKKGINPRDWQEAPKSVEEAREVFYDLSKRKYMELAPTEKTKLAETCCGLVASGNRKSPSYGIFDLGEGQQPKDFEDTFLSLHGSNKKRIPFVQGKFNQGSTGVLPFCGRENFKLIVSKRCPDIPGENDPNWGFTLIRRNRPSEGTERRTSFAEYFSFDGSVPSFESDGIFVIPTKASAYGDRLTWGTYVKLYEYELPKGMRSNILFDLNFRLSALLVNPILPIRLYETRDCFRANTPETTMTGLGLRLLNDRGQNVEKGFPLGGTINTTVGELPYEIYVLVEGAQKKRYSGSDGVIFTINGQSHGAFPNSFFKNANMGYLADSIIVLVNCSDLLYEDTEEIFQTSRDRLRDNEKTKAIKDQLIRLIKNDPTLKELQNQRRKRKVDEKIENQKHIEDIFSKLLKHSPALKRILTSGNRLPGDPFGSNGSDRPQEFIGRLFPTFFNELKPINPEKPKSCQAGRVARIKFQTDAVNDYLSRTVEPGSIQVTDVDGYPSDLYSYIRPNNGIWTVELDIPSDMEVGSIIRLNVEVSDVNKAVPLVEAIHIKIEKYQKNKSPNNNEKKKGRAPHQSQKLPTITEVRRDEWEKYDFNEISGLKVICADEGYDFFINMDNKFLLNEIKGSKQLETTQLEYKFKHGLYFLAFPLINEKLSKEVSSPDEENIEEAVLKFTSAAASVILPIINALSEFESYEAEEAELNLVV